MTKGRLKNIVGWLSIYYGIGIFTSDDPFWDYYGVVRGFYKDDYIAIYLTKREYASKIEVCITSDKTESVRAIVRKISGINPTIG